MKRLLGTAVLALGATAALMAQGNNVSVYIAKDIAGVLPPVSAATTNSLFIQIPEIILADKNGNVYITDTGGHRVWKVDSSGKVTLVIGTGVFGGPTSGRAANTQAVGEPSGLALDPDGNLYITDRNNARIYKIDTAGVVTIFAGLNGQGRYVGDGRLASQSEVNGPRGIVYNPLDNSLLFADTGDQRIRKIDLKTGIITTVAGRTTSGSATASCTFSATENCGDGGLATLARLNAPEGVAVDQFGDIFIADTGNNRIRMVAAGTGIITTVAGRILTNRELGLDDNGNPVKNPQTGSNFSAASAPFPNSCGTSQGNANSVRVGVVAPCAPVGDGRDPLQAVLATPRQIVVDSLGNVFIADSANVRIRELVANPISQGNPTFPGFSSIVTVVGTGSSGNAGDGGNAKFASVSSGLSGLSLDALGRLFFTDRSNNRARVFDTTTGLVTSFAGAATFNGDQGALQTMFNAPTGIAVDQAGNIYVADSGNNIIRKIDTNNVVTTIAGVKGGGGGGDNSSENIDPLTAALSNPTGLWVDPSGTTLYFADTGSNRVRRISGGTINTVAGCVFTRQTSSSSLAQNCNFTADGLPATVTKINLSGGTTQNTKRFTGVAVDKNGTLYFSQSGDNVLRKLLSDGTLVTIAGQFGASGLGGDGGQAVNAFLSNPTGIAVDNDGNIIFADTANFAAHIISKGIMYPLAGEPGNNSNDNETSNNQGGVSAPAWAMRWRAIQGVAVDNKGNAFLNDTSNNKVDRIPYAPPAACTPATGVTCPANSQQYAPYRVLGNEGNTANDFVFDYTAPASATALGHTVQLSFPTGVAVDSKGNVFVTDTANNLIREAVAPAPAK